MKGQPDGRLIAPATRHLVAGFRRTRAKLRLLARRQPALLRAAVTTLRLAITGGFEYLINKLGTTWNRRRQVSRDEAGYATRTVIIAVLLVVIAFAVFVFLWMTVISKAIRSRIGCHPGRPCG